jgi:hypothetical protein
VSVTELLIAAKAQEKMNQENRLIKQMLYGAIVVIFVLTGLTFAMTYMAIESAKDLRPAKDEDKTVRGNSELEVKL